ncbi:hypothetical protein O0I10_001932 [Lichtheimia ornata]|uniref:Uncharacterized protein n=1 Tax=Lichtheimia ornata TaxID=688661 RepID=A0AAD7XYU2_9FUNG|nr:uncharacterized protein O0I10_001932 [Lichtheimia ornata]KAJ8662239.1 hypothetical protein O0I10_001932 [Lichtheimia ornata]
MSPYPSVATAQLPPTPQATPRNSSSCSGLSMANALSFSANSNLMNYSLPTSDRKETTTAYQESAAGKETRREIQRGNSNTKTRQLDAQIERLTLQNVKLQRTNRLLKVDTDNLIKQKTQPLEENVRQLTLANVQLQRAARLLQQDLEEKSMCLEKLKQEQITQMKSVGPEYEFLVQMINLLHRQISGDPTCNETCCFTLQPISQSTTVMTLPPENDKVDSQHICRPIVHSSVSQGSYAIELENKIVHLEQVVEELDDDKGQILRQMAFKDNDIETLKKELQLKDNIVSQLEQDFLDLEEQLRYLQHELDDRRLTQSKEEHLQDPKRQSQLLMERKRRSLAIKDSNELEHMLSGDLDYNNLYNDQDEDTLCDKESSTPSRLSESFKIDNEPLHDDQPLDDYYHESLQQASSQHHQAANISIPCHYSEQLHERGINDTIKDKSNSSGERGQHPFALFAVLAGALGFASQLGVTDDWTLPITLAILVSVFLRSEAAKDMQFKVKLN